MLTALLMIACLLLRLLPLPPNFALVGAMAIIAGRTLPLGLAAFLTLLLMLGSDALLALQRDYPWWSPDTHWVYLAFFLQIVLGRLSRHRRYGALSSAVLGSVIFFIISNYGVWVAMEMYPKTLLGLEQCFLAAIPFYPATLLSNVVGVVMLNHVYRFFASRNSSRPPWVFVPGSELSPV